MSDIVLNEEIVGGVTNFQVVGCTIDVGTKIYAARVDALHQNTYQMLSGLGRQNAEDADGEDGHNRSHGGEMDNENGGEEGDEATGGDKRAKTVKKRRAKKSYLAENVDAITSKQREDDFQDVRQNCFPFDQQRLTSK